MIRTESFELVHDVTEELRAMRDSAVTDPTADIDMVWVLSAPGTAMQEASDGIYSGASFDRMNIDKGAALVIGITAARIGIPEALVTKDHVAEHGPVLFYNGEDELTEGANYSQNQDFSDLVDTPDFSVPRSNVIIDTIPKISTPPQVRGLAEYLRDHTELPADKIAVVSLFPHAPRVGRYIEQYRDMFSTHTKFLNAPTPMDPSNALGASVRETRKVRDYFLKGHLAYKSVFGINDPIF
jgi:hypothetical protein